MEVWDRLTSLVKLRLRFALSGLEASEYSAVELTPGLEALSLSAVLESHLDVTDTFSSIRVLAFVLLGPSQNGILVTFTFGVFAATVFVIDTDSG